MLSTDQLITDSQLLGRLNLSPMDANIVEGHEGLSEAVQQHNHVLETLKERFQQLAQDRETFSDADQWFGQDYKTVANEEQRLKAESWNVLADTRRLIQDRIKLAAGICSYLDGQVAELDKEYDKAFKKTCKALEREHRVYLKANPSRAESYITGLAEEEPELLAIQDRIVTLGNLSEQMQTMRYRCMQTNALTTRQRDVFAEIFGQVQ